MATQTLEVYKCPVCGIVAEILDNGAGELSCCAEPMTLLAERTSAEEGREKHVPVIEDADGGVKVKVGSVPHPMEDKHFIEWIEVLADGKVYRRHLKPGDAPEATFELAASQIDRARIYCNLHNLWRS